MTIKQFFTKRRCSGFFILFIGLYVAWIVIDCYYNQSLAPNQIKSMAWGTVWFFVGGTFYIMPKLNSFKEFFTKDIIGGLFNILAGTYISWIAIDCFYEQTLSLPQIKAMGVIGFLMILFGYYYLMKEPKAT